MSASPRLTALVTGASRGIGRAIAQQLAARGCRIAVHYQKNHAAAQDTLQSLAGTEHANFAADIGNPYEVARLWREVSAAMGHVDLLVNNAGIFTKHPALVTAPADWQAAWQTTLAVNLAGPAQLCHLAGNAMARADVRPEPEFGRGRIVNISSRGAFRGEPHAPAYGASKAGINSLSQSLARDFAPHGIYVFCLAPGWVDTEMAAHDLAAPHQAEILAQHPLGRVATADEVARAAVFCALDAPATMTGCIIDVNGASYLRT
jgi:3-oxoacyl-[acyl-carrier protein] reductase